MTDRYPGRHRAPLTARWCRLGKTRRTDEPVGRLTAGVLCFSPIGSFNAALFLSISFIHVDCVVNRWNSILQQFSFFFFFYAELFYYPIL